MEVSHKLIFESLAFDENPIRPNADNLVKYSERVEDFIIAKSGLNRGNISRNSAEKVSEAAQKFTKKVRKIYGDKKIQVHNYV